MGKGLMGIRKLLCLHTLSFHTFFPIVPPILHLTTIDHETETDG